MTKWYHVTLPCIDFESMVYRLMKPYQEVLAVSRDMRMDGEKRARRDRYR